jgi:hypothetical protein
MKLLLELILEEKEKQSIFLQDTIEIVVCVEHVKDHVQLLHLMLILGKQMERNALRVCVV